MNCSTVEPLLLAERDGALSASQRAVLAQHVAVCPTCRQLQHDLGLALDTWKTAVAAMAVPDAPTAWALLQPRLTAKKSAPRRKLATVIWLSAPLAAAAALAFVFYPATPSVSMHPSSPALARAEYVEAGNANASTMVYVDKESGWLVVWAVDATGSGKS